MTLELVSPWSYDMAVSIFGSTAVVEVADNSLLREAQFSFDVNHDSSELQPEVD